MKMILTDILLGDMVNYISNEPYKQMREHICIETNDASMSKGSDRT
jgi:hypothetical protein